jgi:hypothetical protein
MDLVSVFSRSCRPGKSLLEKGLSSAGSYGLAPVAVERAMLGYYPMVLVGSEAEEVTNSVAMSHQAGEESTGSIDGLLWVQMVW